jgi:hypothetical protein
MKLNKRIHNVVRVPALFTFSEIYVYTFVHNLYPIRVFLYFETAYVKFIHTYVREEYYYIFFPFSCILFTSSDFAL